MGFGIYEGFFGDFQKWVSLCGLGWPWTCNLPASASRVVGITGMLNATFFITAYYLYKEFSFWYFYISHFSFGHTRVWTHGFVLARQEALYCLSHTSRPFCSGYFGYRVSLFAQAGLDSNTPILSFSPSPPTPTPHPPLRQGLKNFFALLAWSQPPK
jgi:hypothetical protein